MRDWVSFSEIKNRVTLEEVLRHYQVDGLRPGGIDQYRGRCPIHQGQGTEAFHANLRRGVFHCFACGAGGNVLDFVTAMESCSIREAALRLRGLWPDTSSPTAPAAARRSVGKELVTKGRGNNPPLGFTLHLDRRHEYLARRGIDNATADSFGVGYFGGPGLMSGRIAIPIHDDAGQLVAYGGRTVDRAEPRYRFPAGFQKSQVLFNYHRACAVAGDQVIVVEGFFDCMRVHQAGVSCVVALMGARLSRAQKDLLTARFSKVVLLLDGDLTGRAATARIANDLRPACSVTERLLAPGLQPDQMTTDEIRRVLAPAERRQAIGAN
jgi:DNA primase